MTSLARRLKIWFIPSRGAVLLLLLCCVMVGATLWASFDQFESYKTRQEQLQQQQRQSGLLLEQKLCTTLDTLRNIQPPPLLTGSTPVNSGRMYDRAVHDVLAQLAPDVGCPR